jgi:hypothetical protein
MSRVHKVATVQFELTNIARMIELCEAGGAGRCAADRHAGDGHNRLLLVRQGGGRAVR